MDQSNMDHNDLPPNPPSLDPSAVQRQASDPKASVWVTASAGTGKTKVLTDRVLRLMLSGAKPDQILCLTFTRAGAAVMTIRIREELGQWASCSDDDLKKKLRSLNGVEPDTATTTRARQLFGEFLDAHGGVRIQTIHAFAQALIRRFPIEADIPPYFDVMDDQTAADLLREAQADVLQDVYANSSTPLAHAARMVTPEVSVDDFQSLINELTSRRGQLLSIIDGFGGLEKTIAAVYGYLQAPLGIEGKAMEELLHSDSGLNGRPPRIDDLNTAAEMLLAAGSPTEQARGLLMKAWLDNPDKRLENAAAYASVFMTKEKTVRKRLTTKNTADVDDIMQEEAARLDEGVDAVASANVARGTESILRMAMAILDKYTEEKRARNLLDYDDLIHRTNIMMKKDNAAGWVLQKLPGDLKHILVDEAQDTNPDQWDLIAHIAREFFTNPMRVKDQGHTFFVVGDEKQSIFSFQRADPKIFAERRKYFAELVEKAGGTWRRVEMEIAFRSSAAITDAVDAVFANAEAADGLFSKDEAEQARVRHTAFRQGQAGRVEVHPLLVSDKETPPSPWALPLQREETTHVNVALAEKIADQIKGWIDSGEKLESRDRPISPSDILILVRRRTEFVDHVVRALKNRDIPVAGADRLSLREQIGVQDLLALGDVVLFPKDDLKLAVALKTPLIGMTDQHLEDLAANRPGDLWSALEKKANTPRAPIIYRHAFDYLMEMQRNQNSERPYEFYASLLMNACPANKKSGLNAIFGRLGRESEDAIVEFLNAVERFEAGHVPSLQGFLAWLSAGEAEVKREMNLDPETPRVHIMTVHGAKGLEAPIVILPDTTGVPSDNTRGRPKFLWPENGPQNDRQVPLWTPRADLECKVFTREQQQAELEREREYRRLMYVAMTRAADRLYVYGTKGMRALPENSWYNLIGKGLVTGLSERLKLIKEEPKNPTLTEMFGNAVNPGIPEPFAPQEPKSSEPKNPPPQPVNDNQPEDGNTAPATAPVILRFDVPQTAAPKPDGIKPMKRAKKALIPAWARTRPTADQTPTSYFRPSQFTSQKVQGSGKTALSPLLPEGRDRFKLGTIIHNLMEYLPDILPANRATAAGQYLARPEWALHPRVQEEMARNIMDIIESPVFAPLFGPNSRPEVPISGTIIRDGKPETMTAIIDRLVVEDDRVLIIDFKSNRDVPKKASDVAESYILQMAAYRHALQQIYPGRKIECGLLYTRAAKMIPLPATRLDQALNDIGIASKRARSKKPPKQSI